jgi:outer membrane protein assembly factor BamD (BamD/ComL family)
VRNLFKEKIHDLRTRFALAVQDHKWAEAVRVGEEIVRDFPNSGIAREVKDKLDTLRQRAAEPQTAGV